MRTRIGSNKEVFIEHCIVRARRPHVRKPTKSERSLQAQMRFLMSISRGSHLCFFVAVSRSDILASSSTSEEEETAGVLSESERVESPEAGVVVRC